MGDEMDPCECLWNHELSMRRLLSLLRQGQSYCTDIGCVDESPGSDSGEEPAYNTIILPLLMMAFAFALIVIRPRRNQIQDAAKPTSNRQDRDGAPPTPPRI